MAPAPNTLPAPTHRHWPSYLTEAVGAACFVVGSGLATLLAEHPASPVAQALVGHAVGRRAVVGVLMASVLCGLVHNPWARRSGAHFIPAVTLGVWQLGHISAADAGAYVLAQVLGATGGAALLHLLCEPALSSPSIKELLTQPKPGAWGAAVAFGAEFLIAGGLMLTLVGALHSRALHRAAGVLVAVLLGLYITIETPLSGMSLNPARSLSTAVAAGNFRGLWVYWTAPPLAMWLAAVWWKWHRGPPLARALRPGRGPRPPGGTVPPQYPIEAKQ